MATGYEPETFKLCNFSGFHGSDCAGCDILGLDTVQSCGWILILGKTMTAFIFRSERPDELIISKV
jgi:hypothetical protein